MIHAYEAMLLNSLNLCNGHWWSNSCETDLQYGFTLGRHTLLSIRSFSYDVHTAWWSYKNPSFVNEGVGRISGSFLPEKKSLEFLAASRFAFHTKCSIRNTNEIYQNKISFQGIWLISVHGLIACTKGSWIAEYDELPLLFTFRSTFHSIHNMKYSVHNTFLQAHFSL